MLIDSDSATECALRAVKALKFVRGRGRAVGVAAQHSAPLDPVAARFAKKKSGKGKRKKVVRREKIKKEGKERKE